MAIPSSGPISLTTVQTEFGGSNPIGINEYYAGGGLVPAGTSGTYGAVPSSGTISLQNFYGTSNVVYAINTLSNTQVVMYGLAIDASNNVHLCSGYYNAGGTWIGKYDSNLNPIWQRYLSGAGFDAYGGCITDSSSNVYIIGNSGGAATHFVTVKLNSSGSIVWQNQFNRGSSESLTPAGGNSITADGNTLYFTGYGFCKINTSDGSPTYWANWGSGFSGGCTGGQTDSSGNFIFTFRQSTGGPAFSTCKVNSSETRQWGRQSDQTSFVSSFQSLALLSNGNFVVVGFAGGSFKISVNSQSTGDNVWSNGLNSSNTFRNFSGVTVDSSNNIYATFSIGSPYQWIVIVKYNSAGTIQWIRKVVADGKDAQSWAIKTDSIGNVYCTANWNNTGSLVKIPADGSKTGSWTINGILVTYAVEASCTASGSWQGWYVQNTISTFFSRNSASISLTSNAGSFTNVKQVI